MVSAIKFTAYYADFITVPTTMKQASALALNILLGTSIHHGFSTASAIPPAQFPPSYQSFQPKTSTGYQGGVASESAECTKIGKDLLAIGVCCSHRPFFKTVHTEEKTGQRSGCPRRHNLLRGCCGHVSLGYRRRRFHGRPRSGWRV